MCTHSREFTVELGPETGAVVSPHTHTHTHNQPFTQPHTHSHSAVSRARVRWCVCEDERGGVDLVAGGSMPSFHKGWLHTADTFPFVGPPVHYAVGGSHFTQLLLNLLTGGGRS